MNGNASLPKPLLDGHTRVIGQVDFDLRTLVLRISEAESHGTDWRKRDEIGTA